MNVSVVIPIYNTSDDLIERCIESLENQFELPAEIILVNDGSEPEATECCNRMAKEYENIKVFHQRNSGVSVARNSGLKKAQGDWIMFVDPDDYTHPELIQRLSGKIDDDTDIVSCCCMAETKFGCVENKFYESDKVFASLEDKIELQKQIFSNATRFGGGQYTAIGVPWGKIYRRSFLEENNLEFNPDLYRMQDNIFNMIAFSKARKIVYLDAALYYYNLTNITSIKYKYDPRLAGLYQNIWSIRSGFLYSSYPDNFEMWTEFARLILSNIFTMCNRCLFHYESKYSYRESKEIIRSLLDREDVKHALSVCKLSSRKDLVKLFIVENRIIAPIAISSFIKSRMSN